MELDHLFICSRDIEQEAAALRSFGLNEGSSSTHVGQGTANRRFFFHNAFIELLYLRDRDEAQNSTTRPTGLLQRLTHSRRQVSPFGICFRPSPQEHHPAPFPGWSYQPAYLPSNQAIHIGAAPLAEPMWCYLPFASRPDQVPLPRRQPLSQPHEWREITSVRITIPQLKDYSVPAQRAMQTGLIGIGVGGEHLLEIVFDGGSNGQSSAFDPVIPLRIRW